MCALKSDVKLQMAQDKRRFQNIHGKNELNFHGDYIEKGETKIISWDTSVIPAIWFILKLRML